MTTMGDEVPRARMHGKGSLSCWPGFVPHETGRAVSATGNADCPTFSVFSQQILTVPCLLSSQSKYWLFHVCCLLKASTDCPTHTYYCQSRYTGYCQSRCTGYCQSRSTGYCQSRYIGYCQSRYTDYCQSRYTDYCQSRYTDYCQSRYI